MNPNEWTRVGMICRSRRQQTKIGLFDLQELLGVDSISFILRMERGEFAPDLLYHFWNTRVSAELDQADRLSA